MKKTIIIGNGFDLALGLKTKYSDFINSQYFSDLINSGSYLAKNIKEKNDIHGWVDIEKALGIIGKDGNWSNCESEYNQLCAALCSHLKAVQDVKNYTISRPLGIFLDKHNEPGVPVFSFNYTNFGEYIFSSSESAYKTKSSLSYVHGSLAKNDIIFGVNDGAAVDERNSFLYKNYKDNFNPKEFKDAIQSTDELVVYGFSFGESDHMYFDSFFIDLTKTRRNKILTIYYYGVANKLPIYNQINKLCLGQISYLKMGNDLNLVNCL